MKTVKYKLLLFICITLLLTTIVCAADNTTDNDKISDTTVEKTLKETDNIVKTVTKKDNVSSKTTSAIGVSVNNQEAECYYGGRLTYNLESSNNDYVDEGRVDLYINNSYILSKNVNEGSYFDWMYEDFGFGDVELETLNNYPAGDYPIKVVYTNEDTSIESSTATLSICPGQASIYFEELEVNSEAKIIVPV